MTITTATGIVGRIYFGKSFKPGPEHLHSADSVPLASDIRTLNRLLASGPESLLIPENLAPFYKSRQMQFAVVFIDGIPFVTSPPITIEEFNELKDDTTGKKNRIVKIWEWSFVYDENHPASIVFYEDRFSVPKGPFWLLLVLFVFMITVNAVAARSVRKHITGPLEKLEKAAVKIGEGDLDFTVETRGADEVTRLFSAFEEMRKRLKKSLEIQEAQNTSRKELIAAISHDLRTPLTSIKGHVEGLKDDIPKTKEDRERYLGIIEWQVNALDEMISNLFLFSKLDIGEIPLHVEQVELKSFFTFAVEEFLQKKYPAGLDESLIPEISVHIEEGIECTIDIRQFRRVIENILQNSVVHNPDIELHIHISAEKIQQSCRITIADNGSGIKESNSKRLFETMFREDESRNKEGSGLGLSIVERLVSAHGGTVAAHNNTDGTRGLTIEISLPLHGGHE